MLAQLKSQLQPSQPSQSTTFDKENLNEVDQIDEIDQIDQVDHADQVDPKIWFSSKELAEYYGLTADTVQKAACRSGIPGAKKVGKFWYFRKKVVIAQWHPSRMLHVRRGTPYKVAHGTELLATLGKRYLEEMAKVVTTEDWRKVITKAVDQAIEGDHRARKWLSDYLIGVPIQRVAAAVGISAREGLGTEERAKAVNILLNLVQTRDEHDEEDEDVINGTFTVESEHARTSGNSGNSRNSEIAGKTNPD